jgi:hypothetical protein
MEEILIFHGTTADGRRFTLAGQFYATMDDGDIDIIRLGAALCSEDDMFIRKVGRKKAEGRVLAKGNKGKSYYDLYISGEGRPERWFAGQEINEFIKVAKRHEALTAKGFQHKFNL